MLADHPLFFALFLLLGIGYSVPPLRFKAVPFIDSLVKHFGTQCPAFFCAPQFHGQLLNLWIVFAAMFWCAGMHLYSALPDIARIKKRTKTTGVLLGTHAYTMTSVYWLLALVSLSMVAPWTAWLPLVVYVMIPSRPSTRLRCTNCSPT